jgi:DNA repair protein RadD
VAIVPNNLTSSFASNNLEERAYQTQALNHLRTLIHDGYRKLLLVAPTGSGKGTLATMMVEGSVRLGRRSLFLCNRRNLVHDLSRRLTRLGLAHGVIMAGVERASSPVQVASIDTLRNLKDKPPAELIFLDEAHFAVSEGWTAILRMYPDACVVGMTATPIRLDGRGLGKVFQVMVECPGVAALTRMGYLVPTRVFGAVPPDLRGVRKEKDDWNGPQLAEATNRPQLVGDIVDHWLRIAEQRPTVAFACDVNHSQHITEKFLAAGVPAKHVDAYTPDAERDATWTALMSGELKVVSSIGIISYAWDCPPVSCAILARPTESEQLYLQQVGRILRPFATKRDAIVLDHAGNTVRHGFVDAERKWSLDDEVLATRRAERELAIAVTMCQACWRAYPSNLANCPECGTLRAKNVRKIRTAPGELTELKRLAIQNWAQKKGPTDRHQIFLALQAEGRTKGYSPKWCYIQYKIRFGRWPNPREFAHEESA